MENLNLKSTSVEFNYGGKKVKIETGKVARQATAAVITTIDDLVVLTTVVAKKEADPSKDFFPLAVFYQEKFYATGRIPGGFFKREARPTERETLTSRLIDRPIRPLFPETFTNEVQVFCTVLSSGKEYNPDIAAMIGASAAMTISGVPFDGPMGAARVGFIDGNYVVNPSFKELEDSYLDMVVAGTEQAVLMVESEAKELNEDLMLGAVLFAHKEMQVVIDACKELNEKIDEALLYANEYKVDLIDRIKKVDDKIVPVNLTKVFAEIGKVREQIAMLPKPANLQPILESLQALEEYGWELEEDIEELSKQVDFYGEWTSKFIQNWNEFVIDMNTAVKIEKLSVRFFSTFYFKMPSPFF